MGVSCPTVSVIVPTRNRPERLAQCLQALSQLDYPYERVEVIVVDDGSTPPVSVSPPGGPPRHRLRILREAGRGPAAARNRGAEIADGELLAFTDDDCLPSPQWLRELVGAGDERPGAAVGGQTLNGLEGNRFADASQLLVTFLYAYYNTGPGGPRFFASNNLAAPARDFRALGGFDTTFPLAAAEDRDLCERWNERGFPMAYASRAVVVHQHAMSWRSYTQQHFNYGRGAYHFHRRRRHRRGERLRLEPVRFYLNLLACPLRDRKHGNRLQLSGLLVASQLANACGFFREAWLAAADRARTEDEYA